MADTKPWERQRGDDGELEPPLWWDRFRAYQRLGPSRSLLKTVNLERRTKGQKRTTYLPGSWRRAFKVWEWKARAEAWDEYKRQEADEEWADRRKQIKDREWEGANKLLERVEHMLSYPLAEVTRVDKTDDKGKPISYQIFKPVRWRQSDITRFMETASKLARLAAEMETDSKKLDITSKGEQIGELTNDERVLRMMALLQLAQQRALEEQAGE